MAKRRRDARSTDHPRRVKAHLKASKAGAAPGFLQYVGAHEAAPTLATLIEFGANSGEFIETKFTALEQGREFKPTFGNYWLNLHGLGDTELLKLIGRRFRLHPLVLEDILNTQQRPKVETYPGYLFITARLMKLDDDGVVDSEQISLVVGHNFLLTFQEKPTGTFEAIRESLRNGESQLRKFGTDYLVYALLDKVVDRYFAVLEQVGERVDNLEDEIIESLDPQQMQEVQYLRRSMQALKRGLWPLREVINILQRDDADFFKDETQLYLRDVYDHTVQLIESVEALRDVVSGLQDIYLSLQSQNMNTQMRTLTVFTIIFSPLTLIAGIYGMNFDNMPELHWQYGYFIVLALMGLLGSGLGLYFWSRRWIE
ncbi:magnesium/cobalt transporter CorA [Chitinibacter bivalviorum]|uniref:Magnesium transport protein CorA n=1 Tax=Chitinibacter bivalviorum TaxID=2739434 RepID=A0A7H9BJT0_9NEIS|nr:magnesium/cobalt transporter CorA [Chitinibacter bivalviorum]QLG88729.1 magnesium/cobalt transporter CorA [Chitinibacter bivalviorum]